MHPLFADLPTTIFSRMSALAQKHDAINLGQGFPEVDGAPELRELAARALVERSNQYPPTLGLPELRRAVAEHTARFDGVHLDPESEIVITSGATEALAATFLSLVAPGDEVVVFEPAYDAYVPLIRRAGGVVRFGRLEPPYFQPTAAEFERVLTPRTRLVVLNTPNNPGASCLDPNELEPLLRHVERFGSRVVADEVWERIVFDEARHLSLLAVPRLREHVVKIGSAGKMFSLTGWKVGFVCASPELTRAVARAHQFLTFTTPPALQIAAAAGLAFSEEHFHREAAALARSRDLLRTELERAGYVCLPSQATYFLNVDLRASGIDASDVDFARFAVERARVATIPLSAFYDAEPPTHLARLCFAKTDATLLEGARRLAHARELVRAR